MRDSIFFIEEEIDKKCNLAQKAIESYDFKQLKTISIELDRMKHLLHNEHCMNRIKKILDKNKADFFELYSYNDYISIELKKNELKEYKFDKIDYLFNEIKKDIDYLNKNSILKKEKRLFFEKKYKNIFYKEIKKIILYKTLFNKKHKMQCFDIDNRIIDFKNWFNGYMLQKVLFVQSKLKIDSFYLDREFWTLYDKIIIHDSSPSVDKRIEEIKLNIELRKIKNDNIIKSYIKSSGIFFL